VLVLDDTGFAKKLPIASEASRRFVTK